MRDERLWKSRNKMFQYYAVNQSLCRQGRRNIGVEKVERRLVDDSRVMQFPSKGRSKKFQTSLCDVECCRRRRRCSPLEVSEAIDFLNFRWQFYSRVWVESAPKNFDGEGCWLGEKKEKGLLNCKYKVTFQLDGCAESTSEATCLIHFGFGHRLDNTRLLKCTFVVFYSFVYLLFLLVSLFGMY